MLAFPFYFADRRSFSKLSYLSSISLAVYPIVMHPLSDPFIIELGSFDATEVIERADKFF